jgi:hypothetical protein
MVNNFDRATGNICGKNGNIYNPYSYPVHDAVFTAAIGLAPVEAIRIESDIEER